VCADQNSENQSDKAIDHDPDDVLIVAEDEKQDDLDHSFSNENHADHEREKNNPKQRIYQQTHCSDAIQAGISACHPEVSLPK